jgi:hypothetical protein
MRITIRERSAEMAKTKTEAVDKTVTAPAQEAPAEDTYPLSDLMQASRQVFGVPSEVVVAALMGTKKQEYTVTEVRAAINEFMNKEVK